MLQAILISPSMLGPKEKQTSLKSKKKNKKQKVNLLAKKIGGEEKKNKG
jgi:hypothetical protein